MHLITNNRTIQVPYGEDMIEITEKAKAALKAEAAKANPGSCIFKIVTAGMG